MLGYKSKVTNVPGASFRTLAIRVGAVLAALVGLIAGRYQLGEELRHLSYDYLFPFRRQVTPDDLVIVALDDASHQALQQPDDRPWDRTLHARLLDRMTRDGAKVVVFDILFDQERDPNADATLETALRANGKTILAASLTDGPSHPALTNVSQVLLPIERFRTAAAGFGVVELKPNLDRSVRWFHPGDWEPSMPTLAWAAATLVGVEGTRITGAQQVPRLINHYTQPGGLRTVSFAQALDPDGLPNGFFRDKYVFVGAQMAMGFSGSSKESFATPWTRWHGRFAHGVELHATMFLNLVRADYFRRMPPWLETSTLLLLGLLSGAGLGRLRPVPGTLVALGLIPLTSALGILWVWSTHVYFPWMIVTAAQIPAALLACVISGALHSLQEARTMERLLALHLPASRARQLRERPDLLKPSAEQMELTIMFSDIANFSAVVQRKSPHDLVPLLSTYFESLIRSVHAEEGTVVKLIGDSVFAVWNAPEPQAKHREHALRAALRMRDVLHEFDLKSQDLPLRTRIGVHTGPAYVGNFGSAERFDYTAIGDSVNLTSRLEGLNEHLGTKILVSRDALIGLEDVAQTRLAGHFRLKGFDRVVEVHELLGFAGADSPQEEWLGVFREALRLFQRREFDEAAAKFNHVLALRRHDGPTGFYLRYIDSLRQNPPPHNWVGEVNMDQK